MIPLIATLVLVSNPIATDKAAHFGISYAATHSCQVFVKKVFDTSKLTSTLTCAGAIIAAGAAKELIDPSIGGERDIKDMTADLAGVGLAVTIINIDW